MTYLLALIALVTIAMLCWKAFGPQRPARTGTTSAAHKRILGPDDDPEFLWRLSRQHRDGEPGSPDS
ncbi:hypothetical protein ABZ319_37915 [Nocardia sp. NPDC005978]|uniref:hypothetical protein n=1 Tax=Nocardia sp. NPDC005978 TaxID=3156725 RepID=UPI0033B61225